MNQNDNTGRENGGPGDRLARLSEASLRITEHLDPDAVLQSVVDGARLVTGALWGGITTLDEAGQLQDFITSGLTAEEHRRFVELPGGPAFFEYLSSLPEPLRLADFSSYTQAQGLPEIDSPLGPVRTFLGAPIRQLGRRVGNLYLSEKEGGQEFTREDEESLVMFAAQAALALANARRYHDEQRARQDLEALVNTAPVGVGVFDARTGVLVSFNQEAARIMEDLGGPGMPPERLLGVMTVRRADGREYPLSEFPIARALSSGETVRAEEIVMRVPDGRSVRTLINATPIHSDDGALASMVVTMQDLTHLVELERLRAEFLTMVSRELLTPLVAIKGSSAAVLGSSFPLELADARQFFRIIDDHADAMLGLLRDMMDVASIRAGTLSVTPESVDVAALVEQARGVFQQGGEAGHVIAADPASELPRVAADRQRATQALRILFTYIARHATDGSSIRVSARRDGFHVAVSVTGKGLGVAAERLSRLLDQPSRLVGGDGEHAPTGEALGLAVCSGIVEAHGGRIWTEVNEAGICTGFTFTLPAADEVAYPAVGGDVDRTSAGTTRRVGLRARILV